MIAVRRSKLQARRLQMPVSDEDLSRLKIGDLVYLHGVVFTGREGVYRMLFDRNEVPPVDLSALTNVTFHCSPAVSEPRPGEYSIPSVTATASFRFDRYLPRLFAEYGVRVVIGKGGMQPQVYRETFRKYGAVYLTTVGYGLGAIYGKGVQRVRDVIWKDELGLAQAMWLLDVENFGPFLVEGDCQGDSLFIQANDEINKKFLPLYEDLPQPKLKRRGEMINPGEEAF